MDTFLIEVPIPSMGATVHELTVISVKIKPGDHVAKGQKIAELESDKSVFEFESPCDGTVRGVLAGPGEVKPSGSPFLRIETGDVALKHLQSSPAAPGPHVVAPEAGPGPGAKPAAARLVWTPRAVKLAQEGGLDPEKVTDIEATGPGNRVSGDDVTRYLAQRKTG